MNLRGASVSWFKDLKTGNKLLLGFGLMFILLAVIVVIAYHTITTIRDSERTLFEQQFTGMSTAVEMRANLDRQRTKLFLLAITTDHGQQESLAQSIQDGVQEVDRELDQLTEIYSDNSNFITKTNGLRDELKVYRDKRKELIQLILSGKSNEAKPILAGVQAQRFEKIHGIAVDLEQDIIEQAKARITDSTNVATSAIRLFIIIVGLALFIGIAMIVVLNRLISRPLVELTAIAERMALGDLTANLDKKQHADEIGKLMQAFSRMTEDLYKQIRELAEAANLLGSSASGLVIHSSQLAASASESAAAVSETAITVEEVRQTAQVASQKAKLVSDSAQKAAQSSQSGRKSIEDVTLGMERIRQQMDAIAAGMVRLSSQSQAIGQIMASVEDLAAQSNLLAVNAAIEAAKAGEHGKGFSVVAQEVKSLAEQSRQATNQVRTILGDIQKATATAVMATEQGSKAVEVGSQQTAVAGEAIQALATSVNEAAQASTQIAASSQQQLVGVDQVSGAMESIKQASVQNVASAQQLEAAAGNLNELGQRFKQMIERYKVSSTVIN